MGYHPLASLGEGTIPNPAEIHTLSPSPAPTASIEHASKPESQTRKPLESELTPKQDFEKRLKEKPEIFGDMEWDDKEQLLVRRKKST